MAPSLQNPPSVLATAVFDLLDPIPFGLFVGALIFDVVYVNGAEVLWVKSAAWLIAIGLVFAVVPRFIELVRVLFPRGTRAPMRTRAAFVVNLLGVAVAILNAFVHSRDAYAVVPEGLWLSILTVALLAIAKALVSLQRPEVTA